MRATPPSRRTLCGSLIQLRNAQSVQQRSTGMWLGLRDPAASMGLRNSRHRLPGSRRLMSPTYSLKPGEPEAGAAEAVSNVATAATPVVVVAAAAGMFEALFRLRRVK